MDVSLSLYHSNSGWGSPASSLRSSSSSVSNTSSNSVLGACLEVFGLACVTCHVQYMCAYMYMDNSGMCLVQMYMYMYMHTHINMYTGNTCIYMHVDVNSQTHIHVHVNGYSTCKYNMPTQIRDMHI